MPYEEIINYEQVRILKEAVVIFLLHVISMFAYRHIGKLRKS
jgi:hypothetical protein